MTSDMSPTSPASRTQLDHSLISTGSLDTSSQLLLSSVRDPFGTGSLSGMVTTTRRLTESQERNTRSPSTRECQSTSQELMKGGTSEQAQAVVQPVEAKGAVKGGAEVTLLKVSSSTCSVYHVHRLDLPNMFTVYHVQT